MNRHFLQAMIIAMAALITGCAGTTVKKEAFARPQKLALVTISGAAHGIYTSDDEDAKILADAAPACLSELSKSRNVQLLPAKAALSSKAYAAIKDEGAMFMQQLLPGYKQFTAENEKKNLHALAKELHVDGFVQLYLNYSKSSSGLSIGVINVGSAKPVLGYSLVAVNPDGDIIWRDQIQVEAEEGIFTSYGVGAYSQMIPKLKGLAQNACQQSVKNLTEQIAAK